MMDCASSSNSIDVGTPGRSLRRPRGATFPGGARRTDPAGPGTVELVLSDTGIGMTEEQQAQLFDAVSQEGGAAWPPSIGLWRSRLRVSPRLSLRSVLCDDVRCQ